MIKYIITVIVAASTIVMGGEITSVSPSSVAQGTDNVTVTFKISASGCESSSDSQSEQCGRPDSDEDQSSSSSRGGGRRGGPGGGQGGGQGGPGGQGGQRPGGMLPPANVKPNSVKIGSITGTSVTHSSMDTVTAVFDIPASSTLGTNTVTITFTDPMGKADVYSSDGFEITN